MLIIEKQYFNIRTNLILNNYLISICIFDKIISSEDGASIYLNQINSNITLNKNIFNHCKSIKVNGMSATYYLSCSNILINYINIYNCSADYCTSSYSFSNNENYHNCISSILSSTFYRFYFINSGKIITSNKNFSNNIIKNNGGTVNRYDPTYFLDSKYTHYINSFSGCQLAIFGSLMDINLISFINCVNCTNNLGYCLLSNNNGPTFFNSSNFCNYYPLNII